jgi:8-oxo-dGTP pyrophosphatase MutT (NUDIX family)
MIKHRHENDRGSHNGSTKAFHDVCNNCGKHGHTFKQCKNPITSFGVIIFRVNPHNHHQREYLMIRRKDTLGYIDFMRGKYSVSNHKYILNMLKQMTEQEKWKLANYTFDELWDDLWDSEATLLNINVGDSPARKYSSREGQVECGSSIHPQPVCHKKLSNTYRQEEVNSREKFMYLTSTPIASFCSTTSKPKRPDVLSMPGSNTLDYDRNIIYPPCYVHQDHQTILQHLLMVSNIPDMWKTDSDPIPAEGGGWKEPEWGFPKGRRNHQENDYECALREMTEETGFPSTIVKNIKNILPFDETFLGSNYKSYKHRYFLMYMDYKDSLALFGFERSEVSRMEWKTYEDCIASIRPYNLEKKRLITNIETTLANYRLFLG